MSSKRRHGIWKIGEPRNCENTSVRFINHWQCYIPKKKKNGRKTNPFVHDKRRAYDWELKYAKKNDKINHRNGKVGVEESEDFSLCYQSCESVTQG